jgi:type VI protein secretion system component VasF
VISDVNKTLVQTQTTASAVSASAKDTVATAQLGAKEVVDQIYRRALTLLVIALIGVPVALLLYRAMSQRLFRDQNQS